MSRAYTFTLAITVGALAGVLGPALDAGSEAHETPADVARAARAAADAEGLERLAQICRRRHGPDAEFLWTSAGRPVCTLAEREVALGGGQP